MLQGLKSAKVLQQSITALFFPLHISCFCLLAAALKRFHENSEAEQVGVVAPGVRTAEHDEDATQEGFSVICASAAYTHCQAVIINTGCVAHIQNDEFSSPPSPSHVNGQSDCWLFALMALSK